MKKPFFGSIFLLIWQGAELFFMFAFIAVTFLMYAFSGNKNITSVWQIILGIMFIKTIVAIFFYKKKRWAIIFNIIQNLLILLFIAYSVYYTLFNGDYTNLPSMLFLVAIIIATGIFYYGLIKSLFNYLSTLK